ncbi:ferric reductase like transmembrane component [Xylariomycetidae sp. FL2044]|nr:ferric reductase like transmembrane component [Xylariomycetidae sp. FL2044]
MGWPYQFLSLDKPAVHARRQSLDRHALVAQLSALLPVAIFLLYRLVKWVVGRAKPRRGAYSAVPDSPVVPSSPTLKRERLSPAGSWTTAVRRIAWWFGDDIVFLGSNWGRRDQMVAGLVWTGWLMVLCVQGTGNDYLHLTKRFGIIGVSQFPVQYLLALKSLNPFAFAFGSSHEQVNRWHRVLGRIIYFLLVLHACFYLNFYFQQGILSERIVNLVPFLGLTALTGMILLNTTAFAVVRQYSYRVFFIIHLIVALALPPIIYFHAHHSSPYVIEAIVVFFLDLAKRKAFNTVEVTATIEPVPGTDLVKIVAPIAPKKSHRFLDQAGSHIYLNIPKSARPSSNPLSPAYLVFEFMFSPFTIAAFDEEAKEVTLVARRHQGPMTRNLSRHAAAATTDTKVPLSIDGPYGCATSFPNLAGPEFDQILLVAGGVGATFIIPIYRSILKQNPAAHAQMIWAVRGAGDATWPVSREEESILTDDNVQLFLTGDLFESSSNDAGPSIGSDGIEMSGFRDQSRYSVNQSRRPNLKKIVDDLFRLGQEDRIAVLVCGPNGMARELRKCVGEWAKKGRDVWWHHEGFAW